MGFAIYTDPLALPRAVPHAGFFRAHFDRRFVVVALASRADAHYR